MTADSESGAFALGNIRCVCCDLAIRLPSRLWTCLPAEHYLLDRPRRRTMSGWPKRPGPERFDRQAYPYDLTQMLGGEQAQDVDVELNT